MSAKTGLAADKVEVAEPQNWDTESGVVHPESAASNPSTTNVPRRFIEPSRGMDEQIC